MSSLNSLSSKHWEKVPKWLVGGLIALAVLGFVIATFLTEEHLRGTFPPCSIIDGCQTVLASKYAQIGLVPTAALGMVYYLLLIVAGVAYLDSGRNFFLVLAGWLTVIGVVVSIYLVYLQFVVIKAICPYCMASALICFLLLGIDLIIWRSLTIAPEHHKKLDHRPDLLV